MSTLQAVTVGAGRVLLMTDGQLAKACCCDCCMYPALEATNGIYEPDTLLAVVEFGGDTLNHDAGLYKYTGSTYYIILNTTSVKWDIKLLSDDSLVQEQDCLIFGGVTDQLEDEYLITGGNGSPGFPFDVEEVLVTRQSRCVWSGVNACGNPWIARYKTPVSFPTTTPHFELDVWHHLNTGTCDDEYQVIAGPFDAGRSPDDSSYTSGERTFTVTIPPP